MSRRNRTWLIGIVVLLLLIELGVRFSMAPRGVVEVINHGSGDLVDLRVTAGDEDVSVDRIAPNSSAILRIGGRSRSRIRLTFSQAGSALSLVQFDDYDPPALNAAHEKYVVDLTDNGFRAVREDIGSADDGWVHGILGSLDRLWNGTP